MDKYSAYAESAAGRFQCAKHFGINRRQPINDGLSVTRAIIFASDRRHANTVKPNTRYVEEEALSYGGNPSLNVNGWLSLVTKAYNS